MRGASEASPGERVDGAAGEGRTRQDEAAEGEQTRRGASPSGEEGSELCGELRSIGGSGSIGASGKEFGACAAGVEVGCNGSGVGTGMMPRGA